MKTDFHIKTTQPLLKVGSFILVNGNRKKITYISDSGVFEWNTGWANIDQLETYENHKSKIIFKLKNKKKMETTKIKKMKTFQIYKNGTEQGEVKAFSKKEAESKVLAYYGEKREVIEIN